MLKFIQDTIVGYLHTHTLFDITKINWVDLSENQAAIRLLENNLDKINWRGLSANPSLFKKNDGWCKVATRCIPVS